MKFDALEYLQAWGGENKFPAIHDALFAAIRAHANGNSFCDLGACTGLLAQRIKTAILGSTVCAIEANAEFTERGRMFGIDIPTMNMRVTRSTVGQLAQFLESNKVTTLVARRVMPELWGEDIAGGKMFSTILASAGVTEIFLQGRVVSARSTNKLSSIEEEVKLFAADYKMSLHNSSIAYLSIR